MPAGRLLFSLALVVSLGVCAGAGEAAAKPGGVVIHGYPYAPRCPAAG
jgi:hypothetical protein